MATSEGDEGEARGSNSGEGMIQIILPIEFE